MPAPRCGRALLVFDFDWSLVNENSDTWVLKQLRPELLGELGQGQRNGLGWTKLMDSMFGRLHDLKDLDECLAGIPIEPEMIDAVRLARKLGYWIAIVSDANSYFIEHILKSYGIEDCFDCIHTNPAFFESGDRLRVKPFHSAESPHECCRCPVNMCKTKVLSGLQSKLEAVSVIYVGDGQGDVCPALSLSSADSVFARRGYSLHDYLTRPDVTCAARIYEWSNGADVKALVENIQ